MTVQDHPAPPDGPAGAAPQALIEVEDFHKVYRETVAVSGISFRVESGQILGLVGPNGAGKTTTLRALAGIIPATRGRLLIAGHDVASDPVAAKKELAYVPVDPHLFGSLTVREHLEFMAATYGVEDLGQKWRPLLDRFELTPKADTIVQELSRGMQQKVAICCAYLHRPRVILFDEPLTGLDPRGIRTLKDSVGEEAARGSATIISSHLLNLVEDLCTHLLILHRGESLYCGPINQVRQAFPRLEAETNSLEELFLRLTDQNGQEPAR